MSVNYVFPFGPLLIIVIHDLYSSVRPCPEKFRETILYNFSRKKKDRLPAWYLTDNFFDFLLKSYGKVNFFQTRDYIDGLHTDINLLIMNGVKKFDKQWDSMTTDNKNDAESPSQARFRNFICIGL
jgi:hypothetical protein